MKLDFEKMGGLIPAKSASKCDPVKALRSE